MKHILHILAYRTFMINLYPDWNLYTDGPINPAHFGKFGALEFFHLENYTRSYFHNGKIQSIAIKYPGKLLTIHFTLEITFLQAANYYSVYFNLNQVWLSSWYTMGTGICIVCTLLSWVAYPARLGQSFGALGSVIRCAWCKDSSLVWYLRNRRLNNLGSHSYFLLDPCPPWTCTKS